MLRRLPDRRHVGAAARRAPRRCASSGEHFVDCIEHGTSAPDRRRAGLRVVRILEAATSRWRRRGRDRLSSRSTRSASHDPVSRSEGAVPSHQARDRRARSPACSTARSSCSAARSRRSRRSSPRTAGAEHGIGVEHRARARCTWRCWPPASAAATRSSPSRSRSSRPCRPSATPARQPVLRRHRSAHVHHGSGADRGGDHAAHQGDHAGAPLRPAGRHGPDPRDRQAPRPGRDRGRRAGARRRVQGAPRRQPRRHRLLQLLPGQEPRRLRRGRRRRHRRATRVRANACACCATGAPRRSITTS